MAKYLSQQAKKSFGFFEDIYPKMKRLASDAVNATFGKIDPSKRQAGFEIFGLDFMVDQSGKVYLIEINTNPCLELSSHLLGRIQ